MSHTLFPFHYVFFSLKALSGYLIPLCTPDFLRSGYRFNKVLLVGVNRLETHQWLTSTWTIFLAFIFFSALAGLIYCRLQMLKRKNEKLQEKVLGYTTKLESALRSIQSSEKQLNRQLYIYTRLMASLSHDVKNPMRYLVAGAERTQKLIDKKAYDEAVETARIIETSARNMQQLLENSSSYIKTHFLGAPIPVQEVQLAALAQQKAAFFLPQLREQQNELTIQVDPAAVVQSNEQLLSIIVQNLLDNANKHTCQGKISLNAEKHADQVYLTISDLGPGLPDRFLTWINSKSGNPSHHASCPKDYNKLGLLLVKELAVLLNIELHAENNNGTRIQLIFAKTPVTAKALPA